MQRWLRQTELDVAKKPDEVNQQNNESGNSKERTRLVGHVFNYELCEIHILQLQSGLSEFN